MVRRKLPGDPIRFHEPFLCGREREYVEQVLGGGVFAGNGPFGQRVQAFLETTYSIQNVLLTHSCTGALEISALLLDLAEGDQVILPSYTYPSTAAAFLRAGADIMFCEVDPATMSLDADHAASLVGERTRAIVPMHYGGLPAPMDAVLELARNHDLVVIEDAAQALGSRHRGNWLGSLGHLGAISFHETKNIHCGLGGALFVNDSDYFERAEDIWERGTNRGKSLRGEVDKYSWVELGGSFYPSELQAAFLLAQLEAYDQVLERRRWIYGEYEAMIEPLVGEGKLAAPPRIPIDQHNAHAFFVTCNSVEDCDALRGYLAEQQIQAFIGYVPLHSAQMGRRLGYKIGDLPITEDLAARVLRLPFHNYLDREDMSRIRAAIEYFYSKRP